MVTHDQGEALAIADRIAVMRAGRLLQAGTPREVYTSPVDPFTGAFVGVLNVLPAEVGSQDTVRILGRLRVTVNHSFANGTRLLATVRPEAVEISQASDTPAADRLAAKVVNREFQGAFVRLWLAVDGLDRPLLADVGNNHAFAEQGADVTFRFPAGRIRLFAVP
jgi:ABC-type Fe3+/spermidine/putrescine transport system ATPase subunit